MKAALLLVDWQQDFLSRPGVRPNVAASIGRAATLLASCRRNGVAVIHCRLVVDREPDTRMRHWKEERRWQCVRGTPGAEAPGGLAPRDGETVVEKHGYRVFAGGELRVALGAGEIDTVIISGLFLHACVRAAALEAHELGYRVWIAEDAVGSDRPLAAAETREFLAERGIGFASVETLAALTGGEPLPVRSGGGDVAMAVAEAVRGWQRLRDSDHGDRVAALRRLASMLEEHSQELALRISESLGKPISMSRLELQRCMSLIEAVCSDAGKLQPQRLPDGSQCRRGPLGVVAMLTPWNHPLAIAVGKLAPAILYGNSVVWKPAPLGAAIARRLMELARSAGWPDDWLKLLEGGSETGSKLMRHPGVAAVTLTGGAAAGYAAQLICAERRIPLQAELGGNNAAVVWSDTDLDAAAGAIAHGAFGYAGQRCTANRRAIVERACAEEFLALLIQNTAKLKWGDPLHDDTVIGPLVSKTRLGELAPIVARARADGLEVIQPHLDGDANTAPQSDQPWFPPTIICCDEPEHEVVQEESFGPVLVVQVAETWHEAVTLCAGVREGLVAAVFSDSRERQNDFADRVDAGVIKIDSATADVGVAAPFGGRRDSGVGPPEHGPANIEFYTRWQAIYGRV